MLADPQFDEAWRSASKVDHDILDVPRDRFLIAADAWTLCQTGRSDPARVGTVNGNLRGLWFIAANLVHDLADLNKMEMLRWDVWGAMPHPDTSLKTDELGRLRVPPTVFNALRNRPESALSPAA